MSPRALCAKKISTDEGGLSQSPPFFLGRSPVTGICEKPSKPEYRSVLQI
jgi:hypothetical protein